MTDDEIYQGAMEGDDDALHALVSSTREHVERVCAFFLAEDEALAGAVVGAYSRALVALGKGQRPDLPVKSWLSILATQECFGTLARLRSDYDVQTKPAGGHGRQDPHPGGDHQRPQRAGQLHDPRRH